MYHDITWQLKDFANKANSGDTARNELTLLESAMFATYTLHFRRFYSILFRPIIIFIALCAFTFQCNVTIAGEKMTEIQKLGTVSIEITREVEGGQLVSVSNPVTRYTM